MLSHSSQPWQSLLHASFNSVLENLTLMEKFVLKAVIFVTQTGKGHSLSVSVAGVWVLTVPCASATLHELQEPGSTIVFWEQG